MLTLKSVCAGAFFLFLLMWMPSFISSQPADKPDEKRLKLSYYLYIDDFVKSFVKSPTANLSGDGTTLESSFLAGLAPIYNTRGQKAGTCSASFESFHTNDGYFTNIANYLAIDNGLIVTWFTPTKLLNLLVDSIVNGMVTECIVLASTKVGFNPFYGQKFNMIVSSDGTRIHFDLTRLLNR